ncbi:MAG: flagellar hook-associated protein FlgK [Kofleriaceae bacterium]|nr:flagellar hook-associated protein FlgK [Kofleriaceae bacterium]MBP9166750.1 flagellar hook-associated protein FlgK [Kofleriaceae bacterium]MBP9857146.1 flagellar hook-associated protein FlgK [Kofleriaceae bacterium]
MSSLLSLLGLGAAGLSAQHAGVAVASNNAANVNSPGYSRQRLDLRAEIGPPTLGGVRTGRPERWHDELLSRRERESDAGRAQAQAFAPAMLDLEARLDGGGPPLDRRLATLWAGLERVAAMPSDSLVRAAAIAAAADLAAGFRERAEAVAAARAEADTRIRDQATAVTTAAAELAELNRQHAISPDPVIADRRDQAGRKLAELVGGTGRIDSDGHVHWTLPDGAVLVDGTRSARLEATPDPVTGWHQLTVVDGSSRRDVTTSLTGGSLAGELAFRDGEGAAAAGALDQLAVDVATAWNNVHRAHAGTDGVSGRDLFVPPTATAGAAANFAVDPGVAADPTRLATATPGAGPGDNAGALAMLGLRDQRVAGGGTQTLGDAAIDIVGRVGRRGAEAKAEVDRTTLISDHLGDLRAALSGVDIDEELSNLAQFQHGAEAMTRFIATVDGLLSDLLQRL